MHSLRASGFQKHHVQHYEGIVVEETLKLVVFDLLWKKFVDLL